MRFIVRAIQSVCDYNNNYLLNYLVYTKYKTEKIYKFNIYVNIILCLHKTNKICIHSIFENFVLYIKLSKYMIYNNIINLMIYNIVCNSIPLRELTSNGTSTTEQMDVDGSC